MRRKRRPARVILIQVNGGGGFWMTVRAQVVAGLILAALLGLGHVAMAWLSPKPPAPNACSQDMARPPQFQYSESGSMAVAKAKQLLKELSPDARAHVMGSKVTVDSRAYWLVKIPTK